MKKVKFADMRRALRGKGFVIALCLSVTAVGVSTYIAYDRAISKIGELPGLTDDTYVYESPVNNPQSGVPDDDDRLPAIEFVSDFVETEAGLQDIENEAAEETNFPVRSSPPMIMPVEDGEIGEPFSNGELMKSKTLGVWKTHDGIDLIAPVGTPVMAMTNGVVSEVYADALWGVAVVIDHGDGLAGCYFGLDKNVLVSVGQEVSSGDVIGAVGNTAEIEIAEEPHIHFGVKKNGEWIDPMGLMD